MPSEVPTKCRAITPNDSANLPRPGAFVYVGGDGNVKITAEEEGTVTFIGMSAGDILPVSVVRVFATGTTATNLIAMW